MAEARIDSSELTRPFRKGRSSTFYVTTVYITTLVRALRSCFYKLFRRCRDRCMDRDSNPSPVPRF
jgi:hypothetical protein